MKTRWQQKALFYWGWSAWLFSSSLWGGSQPVDFERQIRPILESACVRCHGADKQEGGFRLDTREAALRGNENGRGLLPGNPEESPIYWMTTLPEDDDLRMPHDRPLPDWQTRILRRWVEEGADWPNGLVLERHYRVDYWRHIRPLLERGGPFSKFEQARLEEWVRQGAEWDPEPEGPSPQDDFDLVVQIRDRILATRKAGANDPMTAYTQTIPESGVKFEMVPIPEGEFLMGSPESKAMRQDDEGPQRLVRIAPFWMGKHEVTWDEYEPFMFSGLPRHRDGSSYKPLPVTSDPVDIVSRPTTPYVGPDFGMGVEGFPAINMTQHAALKYCQWLSAQTGHFYRLPTEAEWEYACRAGTTTAWSWGDDPELMDEYAWHWGNSQDRYHQVGLLKPNPWGLHDMHGNVMEWTLDRYLPNAYAYGDAALPFVKRSGSRYPRVARGGSWYDDPEYLRSAARVESSPDWKIQDPCLPRSIWHLTEALWLGIRVVRPLEVPSAEEMHAIWSQGRGTEDREPRN